MLIWDWLHECVALSFWIVELFSHNDVPEIEEKIAPRTYLHFSIQRLTFQQKPNYFLKMNSQIKIYIRLLSYWVYGADNFEEMFQYDLEMIRCLQA